MCTKAFICVITLSMMFISDIYAAQKAEKVVARKKVGVEKPVKKTVSGRISYVDNKYISIVTSRNNEKKSEDEIGFWIDEGTQANF
ncbi:MAG: hypothetical protein KAR31_08600, partial [Candidatus Omnitrophica bacterium]|nr:hypothetical protein [Candidatus Omnitrophota bacterium]